jgi:hypothetical protein
MQKINIDRVIEHLRFRLVLALEAAVGEVIPSADFDKDVLFEAFLQAVHRECASWEDFPNECVHYGH